MLINSKHRFGWITIILHWVIAMTVIGQFSLGLYMVSLDYYDPDYHVLPDYHKSIGFLFALLLLFRIVWALLNPRPEAAGGVKPIEHRIAVLVQWAMNLLLVVVVCMGYLLSTATGDSLMVFDWFEVPATITHIDHQEDWAGALHYWFAVSIILLSGVHALAALKHHFIDKDQTLNRIIGKS